MMFGRFFKSLLEAYVKLMYFHSQIVISGESVVLTRVV